MANKKQKDGDATVLDAKKQYTIKGTQGSKHLITDQEYVQPGIQAGQLIDAGHAILVGEYKAPEKK